MFYLLTVFVRLTWYYIFYAQFRKEFFKVMVLVNIFTLTTEWQSQQQCLNVCDSFSGPP